MLFVLCFYKASAILQDKILFSNSRSYIMSTYEQGYLEAVHGFDQQSGQTEAYNLGYREGEDSIEEFGLIGDDDEQEEQHEYTEEDFEEVL